MNIPDAMPILSAGAHRGPDEGACIMEYASLLAGEEWTDLPSCTHYVLARAAQYANDTLGDDARQALLPLLPRIMNTGGTWGAEREGELLDKLINLTIAWVGWGADPNPLEGVWSSANPTPYLLSMILEAMRTAVVLQNFPHVPSVREILEQVLDVYDEVLGRTPADAHELSAADLTRMRETVTQ